MSDRTGKEIRAAVDEALRAACIEYAAVSRGPTKRDDWACDEWVVTFMDRSGKHAGVQKFGLPFYCGTGHRDKFGRPKRPAAADVVYSLVVDDTRGESFRDWCAGLGYNEDSRKALATYEQCQRQTDDARRFFGPELFTKLAELVEGY